MANVNVAFCFTGSARSASRRNCFLWSGALLHNATRIPKLILAPVLRVHKDVCLVKYFLCMHLKAKLPLRWVFVVYFLHRIV